jgi:hypothetical protein
VQCSEVKCTCIGIVGQIELRQEVRVHGCVDPPPLLLQAGEVHVHHAPVCLDHAVLQPGSDAQLQSLDVQNQLREICRGEEMI